MSPGRLDQPCDLDRDMAKGQAWDLLGRLDDLETRLEGLERAAIMGLFETGTDALLAPMAIKGGTANTSPDGQELLRLYATIGGFMVWECVEVGATAKTIINATGEIVLGRVFAAYSVQEITGAGVAASWVAVTAGASANIYTDGVDTLTLYVSAGGVVTVARSAGADTWRVIMALIWI